MSCGRGGDPQLEVPRDGESTGQGGIRSDQGIVAGPLARHWFLESIAELHPRTPITPRQVYPAIAVFQAPGQKNLEKTKSRPKRRKFPPNPWTKASGNAVDIASLWVPLRAVGPQPQARRLAHGTALKVFGTGVPAWLVTPAPDWCDILMAAVQARRLRYDRWPAATQARRLAHGTQELSRAAPGWQVRSPSRLIREIGLLLPVQLDTSWNPLVFPREDIVLP
jgi:hypothetical protein